MDSEHSDEQPPACVQSALRKFMSFAGVMGAVNLLSACAVQNDGEDENAIEIGALLPFTKDMAAAGWNIERALLMAAEQVNDSGGLAGKRIKVVARDAPDRDRGVTSAYDLLSRPRLTAVLGPQVAELLPDVESLVESRDIYGMLPSEMALSIEPAPGALRWFHIAPRIESVACAMAQNIYNDLHMRLLILAADDEYNSTFARALSETYTGLTYQGPRPTATLVTFNADEWGTKVNALTAIPNDIDGIALIAYAKTASIIIQDWAATGRRDTWYFGPALRTDVFVDNTPPGSIEGMKGFSANIPDENFGEFAERFAARWGGDTPMTDSFLHYDALNLTALAIEAAATAQGGFPSNAQVRERVTPLSRGSGKSVKWSDIGEGLRLVRQGQLVNYEGASGHVDLTEMGSLESAIETVGIWRVEEGRARFTARTTCLPK